jgi:hypothetical protein
VCKNNLTDISTIIQNVLLHFEKLYYFAKRCVMMILKKGANLVPSIEVQGSSKKLT